MHFTLWPSRTANEGGHVEITWETFLGFVSSPVVADEKNGLEGWSPARFTNHRRSRAGAELVSCIVLDDDSSGLSYPKLLETWSRFAGVVHTSHSHTASAPKYRIVLQCSRDMSPDEHARVWSYARALATQAGQTLDVATKDPSRLWFVPAHRDGAPYLWCALAGAPLDVDAILAEPTALDAVINNAPVTAREPAAPGDRRKAMAVALGSAWPAKGRHEAQLALAGALRAEGWSAEDALEFLCTTARAAGDEDRPKREATIRHTWSRDAGAPITGWTRLKALVDPVLVDVVRGGVGRDAEWTEKTNQRLAEAAATSSAPKPEAVFEPVGDQVTVGALVFKVGGFNAPLPKLSYLIDPLIVCSDVVMLVAHGNSLKTWTAFSLALSVASGRPWLGRFVTKRGRAAILDFESGDYEILRRMKLIGARDEEVGDRLMRAAFSGADLNDPETWITLAALGLELLVVDSFNAASPDTDENDARSAGMIQHASKFANATGCTVVFIHHARKGGGGGDRRETVRGSTALFAACDRIFEFTDLDQKENGVVCSTMRSVKDGAGKRPAPVRVELSDERGLQFVEIEAKTDEAEDDENATQKTNREIVFNILRGNSAGVPKEDLVNMMKGKRAVKFELLSSLLLTSLVVEFRSEKKTWIMLKPGATL